MQGTQSAANGIWRWL